MNWTEEQAFDKVEEALNLAGGDDVRVQFSARRRKNLRYAANEVTTSGQDDDHTLTISVSLGQQTGTAVGNQLDTDSIRELAKQAEQLARLSPPDPEFMPSLGKQTYVTSLSHAADTNPSATAQGAARCLGAARGRGLVASGFITSTDEWRAFGTRNGCRAFQRHNQATVSQTSRTPDGAGSGWHSATARRVEDLDFDRLAQISMDKAEASAQPLQTLEPGRYITLLEPSAVANMANLLRYNLNRRSMDEGRSFLSEHRGDGPLDVKLFPDWIEAYSAPGDPRCPTWSWDGEGRPHGLTRWIRKGAIRELPCDRFWAQKHGLRSLPSPPNWILSGKQGSLSELIARTQRGVLVTSLWYIRQVDPRTLEHTGLTRDGLFWIEDGRIAHPLKNMRFNDSPLGVFANAFDASASDRAVPRRGGGDAMHAPAILTSDFHFSSVSEAV